MASFLLDVAVRAVLIAASTAVVLWALRIKAPAVRHGAWTAVLLAMLLLPLWSVAGLNVPVPVLPPAHEVNATTPDTVTLPPRRDVAPQPVPLEPPPVQVESPRHIDWQSWLLAIYVSGVLVLLARLAIGTMQAQKLRRSAVMQSGRATSDRCATPITVGWWSPTLILPAHWPAWSSQQLDAVLTHERAHARRRDPLVQWVALFNRAVFWFHPLAWWLERRLSTLAEESCDAAVLAAGHSPQDYSSYLLEMARSITREGGRVRIGMAMPGSGLKPRLRQILDGMPIPPVSRVRASCTLAMCAVSSVILAAGTLAPRVKTPPSETTLPAAPSPLPAVNAPSTRVAVPASISTSRPATQGASATQTLAPKAPQFEVVSIKPCGEERTTAGVAAPRAGARGGGAGGWQAQTTPGHVYWDCVTLATLVDQAYADREHPLLNMTGDARPRSTSQVAPDHPKRVRGGPSWIDSDKFTIEAKVPIELTTPALAGSNGRNLANLPLEMAIALRAVLEDRFQLKVRRVTEQQDMYALVVGEGGLNKERVTAPVPGDCLTREQYSDWAASAPPPRSIAEAEAGPRICGGLYSSMTGMEYNTATFAQLAAQLSTQSDRYVLDRTGIDTKFNFKMRSGQGESADDRRASSLAQLGLKIQPVKASAEYFAIDRAERPRPNAPFPTAASVGRR